MMTFDVTRSTTPTFTPVTITITVDAPADLILVTNLVGGVPADVVTPALSGLADALRSTCDVAGIAKATRKTAPIFNWGKRLREAIARIADLED